MKTYEIETMRKNPLKEIIKRFNDFKKEIKKDSEINVQVDSYILEGGHSINYIGHTKNFVVHINIRKNVL